MRIFAIGDIQGCYEPLRRVLDKADFNPEKDKLWGVGDLVNRGPESLKTLRFLKSLGNSFETVLGNHDLHLLASAYTNKPLKKKDTLKEILEAPDRDELLEWLRFQPLIKFLGQHATLIVHAGLPPFWNINQACAYAMEVETTLKDEMLFQKFLNQMYGENPAKWNDNLKGMERLRAITNILTRMRYMNQKMELDFKYKCAPDEAPANLSPWFKWPNQLLKNQHIVFGHWATLSSVCPVKNLHAIDSGCVWGNHMTLIELGTWKRLYS